MWECGSVRVWEVIEWEVGWDGMEGEGMELKRKGWVKGGEGSGVVECKLS